MSTDFLVLTAANGVDEAATQAAAQVLADTGCATQPANRLAETAVEIPFERGVPDITALRAAVDGVDANIVPSVHRRKKLLIADMDSTIISVECIDELADYAGVKERVADITERAMQGELDFEGAIRERVGLLKGLPESAIQQCYEERVHLNPGARTLVQTMNSLGAMTALVSGGFTYFTGRIAEVAGFQMNRANTLILQDGHLTGEVAVPILGREAKLESLLRLCAEGGYPTAEVIAVGDGANDLSMVEAAGLGVAYHAKPALAQKADARLDYSDLTALLSLQGISEREYAG